MLHIFRHIDRRPINFFPESLTADGTILHFAIMAAFWHARVGMDKKLSFWVQMIVKYLVKFRNAIVNLVQLEIIW
ncbi:MAG: hypothetical protein ACTMH4_11010, partial [Sphingobacterium sp.]